MTEGAPLVTVVVPAWNESANLPGCVQALRATLADSGYEIVIVDDGSRDDTLAVARRLADEDPTRTRVLAHEVNQGLGGALRTGFGSARGHYVTCCPADFRMAPEDWAPFAAGLGKADVIVGCRVRREGYNPLMRFNAWLYPRLVRLLFGLRLRDVNWISVYNSDLVRRVTITQRGIPMLTEILVKLRDLGATFLEVDCRMQPRLVGVPSASRFRVMWRTLTGLFQLWWSYRRPAPAGTTEGARL
jgi:glycosyltransferase involved in cell wall biosynthesis